MLASFELGPILLLVGTMLLIFIVLRRTYRNLGRRPRSTNASARQAAAEMAAAHQAPSGLPLDRAPAEVVRWQIEMHEQAREWSARLDSKMSALAYLIQTADAQIARLEQLQGALAPVSPVPVAAPSEAPPETEMHSVDEHPLAPQTEQGSAEIHSPETTEDPSITEAFPVVNTQQEPLEEHSRATSSEPVQQGDEFQEPRIPAAGSKVAAGEQIKVFATFEVEEQPRLTVHPQAAAADPETKLTLGSPRQIEPQPLGASWVAKPPEDKPASAGKPDLKLFSATKEPTVAGKPAAKSGRPPGAARLSEQGDAGAGAPRLSTPDLDRPGAEDKLAVKRPYEQIYRLADAGYDRGAIARSLGLPLGEVSLILSLRQQQDQTPSGHF